MTSDGPPESPYNSIFIGADIGKDDAHIIAVEKTDILSGMKPVAWYTTFRRRGVPRWIYHRWPNRWTSKGAHGRFEQ